MYHDDDLAAHVADELRTNCQHDGDAVKWNPYNHVVQCHKCGEAFPALTEQYQREATRRILFDEAYRLDMPEKPRKRRQQAGGDRRDNAAL